MKIFFLGLVLVGGAFFLSGCSSSQKPQTEDPMQNENQNQEEELSQEEEESEAGEETIEGKAQWMQKLQQGEKLSCTYTDDQGGEASVFMDGENYRMEYTSSEGNVTSVSREGTMYIWGDQMESGMKVSNDCLSQIEEQNTTAPQEYYSSSEEVVEEIPDISCTSIDSVDTSIPGDISFVDQCEVMEQFQGMENMIPEGVEMMP